MNRVLFPRSYNILFVKCVWIFILWTKRNDTRFLWLYLQDMGWSLYSHLNDTLVNIFCLSFLYQHRRRAWRSLIDVEHWPRPGKRLFLLFKRTYELIWLHDDLVGSIVTALEPHIKVDLLHLLLSSWASLALEVDHRLALAVSLGYVELTRSETLLGQLSRSAVTFLLILRDDTFSYYIILLLFYLLKFLKIRYRLISLFGR